MRIIGGEFRSRRLLAPKTEVTRPITDRAKQSLFDILSPQLADARVYDCFAGTGSMGLECVSRGATHATFFESERSAAALLRKNIGSLHVQARSTVIDRDLFKWFELTGEATSRADILFLDPPYRMVREEPEKLKSLVDSVLARHLAADGVIIFRHATHDHLEFPGTRATDERAYGDMTIKLLRRQ